MSAESELTNGAETHRTLGGDIGLSRRGFLRATAAAGGVAAVGAGANQAGLAPVDEADAFVCGGVCVGAGLATVGTAAVAGWALREYEVLGSDGPAEGLTADVLEEHIYNAARKRKSNNASDFIDNENIIAGIQHVAYSEAKLSAIEKINEEASESEVLNAANDSIDAEDTRITSNFLKGWNESVTELYQFKQKLESHPELSVSSVLVATRGNESLQEMTTTTRELADGTEFELKQYGNETNTGGSTPNDPYKSVNTQVNVSGSESLEYMLVPEWSAIRTELENTFDEVRNGISTWVTNVYSEVQAGELDPAELMSPSELAEVTSDDEQFPQAIHDLMALNVSVDLDREAEVYFPGSEITVHGSLGVDGDTSVSTGTIDPSADDYSYYLTYDVSEGTGTWQDFNSGIDGGTVTLTAQPYTNAVFSISTTAGETVEVAGDQFSDQGDGTWTADLSEDLDTAITEVDSVSFQSAAEETRNKTVRLQNTFEVKGFTDSEGNEHEEADFTQTQTQSDDNYITESEWTDMMEKQQSLIDKYEESQAGGVDNGGDTDWTLIGGIGAVALAALAAIGLTGDS